MEQGNVYSKTGIFKMQMICRKVDYAYTLKAQIKVYIGVYLFLYNLFMQLDRYYPMEKPRSALPNGVSGISGH